jgi:hypothetical protein
MHRALRTLGVLTAGLLLVGGLATIPAVAAEGEAPLAPTVGACYDFTAQEADGASLPRAAVDCAAAHTSEIIAVGTLPGELTWSSAQDDVMAATAPVCAGAWDRVTGGNLLRQARSQYDFVWFQPTAAEQAAGARWFSCHIVVREDNGIAPLPHPLPKLGKRISDAVATCATGSLAFTTCADKHAWRSSHSFYATGKPTKRTVDAAANRTCPRHVTSRKWLRTAFDVPGKRFVVICYSKTSR